MVTVWISKIKRLAQGFLASESSKYITTEAGLKIELFNRGSWVNKTKS